MRPIFILENQVANMKQEMLYGEDEYRCTLSKEVQELAKRELQVIEL